MGLYEKLKQIYPDLKESDFLPINGTILIQDDSNGNGQYIAKWSHGYQQPTNEQLAQIEE